MKNLFEHLKESMPMLEGFRNLKVYTPEWSTNPTICQEWPTKDPYSSDSDDKFDIKDTDWLYDEIGSGTGSIAAIQWCDDHITGYVLNKVHDEKSLKADVLKCVEQWIEANQKDLDDDSYNYIEMYIELNCGATIDMVWEYDDMGGKPTPEKVWDAWIEQFNNSEVDGDSSYARSLVDLKKKKVIAGHEVNVEL